MSGQGLGLLESDVSIAQLKDACDSDIPTELSSCTARNGLASPNSYVTPIRPPMPRGIPFVTRGLQIGFHQPSLQFIRIVDHLLF